MTAIGLSSYMGSLKGLLISNILYKYDTLDGTTILLYQNTTVYMGDIIEYLLENTLQSDENGIQIYIHPKKYYPDDYGAHIVILPDDTITHILYDGVLPYIPVMCPKPEKLTPVSVLPLHRGSVGTHFY